MVWFKVDDNFAFHPKTLAATNSAIGLWVRAGSWCGANLTEGRLPADLISTLGGLKRDARKLVEVGLWDEVDGGYQFRNWEEFQPTKAQVDAEREANRKRQAEYRARKRNGVTDTVTNGATNGTPTRPDPTRPNKETSSPLVGAGAPDTKNDRDDIRALCEHLSRRLGENGVKHSISKGWRDAARLLIDLDGRDAQEAHRLIDWATSDSFWRTNVLSMPKFREKYDQLRLKAQEGNGFGRPSGGQRPGEALWDLPPTGTDR